MAKEGLHRRLALAALPLLTEGEAARLVHTYPAAYQLGSVAPDALFNYEIFFSKDGFIKNYRSYAHSRSNTLAFFADYFKTDKITEEGLSYLIGALTHVCADTVFHPMVYHFSGYKTTDGLAMARHFRLESLMDMALITMFGPLPPLKTLVKQVNLKQLAAAFNAVHFGEKPPKVYGPKAIKIHAFFDSLYPSQFLAKVAAKVSPNLVALFYSGLPNPLQSKEAAGQIWQQPFTYEHAVTGEALTASFEQLFDMTVQLICVTVKQINECFIKKDFTQLVGANLDTGVAGVKAEAMNHFKVINSEELFIINEQARQN
ncbi:MAG: zinc dependent phospholipase C family protein [Spirochaetaceae bacterium]|nr:zinc dependent phospholipase C family protein [Spirochaetaceae bacterium]